MAAFSVEDRARPGPNRRSTEISKVSSEAFTPVIMTELYPGAVIDVMTEVLQADAGTRTAAINAATIALAEAGIPMKSLVAACAIGKVDGQLVVDLNKDEDNYGEADLPIAFTQDGKITLLQMDGNLTQDELKEAIGMAKEACDQIFELQRDVLLNRFGQPEEIEEPAEETENEPEVESVEETDDEEVASETQEDEAEETSEEEDPEEENDDEVDENADDEEVGGEKDEQ
jgi:exosome complex component RRP41